MHKLSCIECAPGVQGDMQLSAWMEAKGFDDEAVGRMVDADRVTISRIRRGVNRPSWELAAKFKAVSMGAVSADDFLPDLEEIPAPEAVAP